MADNIDSKQELILITESSLQASMLENILEEELNVNINSFSINKLSEQLVHHRGPVGNTVIIDMSHFLPEHKEIYHSCHNMYFEGATEILINCEEEVKCSDLMTWSNIIGVFYVSDSVDMLIKGIGKIMQGELWLSRKLAQEYILYYRKKSKVRSSTGLSKLTKREQQIIALLGNGDSNTQIADKLFVSENTVKTHLHNVFKKIHARNRLQALLWVKENMMEE